MRAVDLIQKKRDGQELTSSEIEWLVEGYVSGTIPDYQMSAFAMAVYFKRMTTREISDLTMKMVKTGQEFDLSAIDGVKVDKHSTGGVGDKVTLILAPLVASFGVPVAKMSGRGLGHTGGTIDKLESIKGYQVERSQEDFIRQVQDIGVSVIGQSDQLVKADKLLYALRDVTATVDTIPLIASSVMSKKIAAGADAILLDVTVGEGAFMKTVDEARELAQTMVDLGKAVGRKTVAVITDMSQPLGRAIGNRLEILEALEILQGQGRQDITHFICELAQIMLGLANVNKTVEEVRQHLENGQALAKFEEMVQAQGGDLEDLYRPVNVAHVVEIPAQETGVISSLPAMEFGLYAMRLGAGRAVKTDDLDYETGIVFEKKVGDSVQKGEIVAKVYTNGKISPQLVTDFQKYVKINDGATTSAVKAFETKEAIQNGADEIDMVINVGALKSGNLDLVESDIRAVVEASGDKLVKVIIEACLLTDQEKIVACQLAQKAEADFVKTSTGFSTGGATIADVQLMRETVGPDMGVKAAGGARSYADALAFVEAGATRIGTSAGVAILKGELADGDY